MLPNIKSHLCFVLPIVTIQFDKGAVEYQYCDVFSKIKKLKTLRIDSPKLSDEGLKKLSAQKSFTRLDLKSDKITDQGLSYLGTLPNLEILSVSSCNIAASGLEVNFKNCPITNSQAMILLPLNTLTSLTFQNCYVTEEGALEVKKTFKQFVHKDLEVR